MTCLKPVVTVGVCARNSASSIRDAIESIMVQDYPHDLMEVIFVDDGSEDSTLSILKSYVPKMDMQVRIFHHKWRGLGFSRNVVVRNASGKYIVWVDGDMILTKNYISTLVDFMERCPKVGVAKGKQSLEWGGGLLATLETYSRAASRMVEYTSEKAMFKSLGTGGCIYRTKVIRQVRGFDENITGYGEDLDVEYKIRRSGWLLSTVHVFFWDYERCKVSCKDIWRRYLKRGYDSQKLSIKRKGVVFFHKMLPPVVFFTGIFHSLKIYRLTRKKKAFLLPIYYIFKMTAWCSGFIKGLCSST